MYFIVLQLLKLIFGKEFGRVDEFFKEVFVYEGVYFFIIIDYLNYLCYVKKWWEVGLFLEQFVWFE